MAASGLHLGRDSAPCFSGRTQPSYCPHQRLVTARRHHSRRSKPRSLVLSLQSDSLEPSQQQQQQASTSKRLSYLDNPERQQSEPPQPQPEKQKPLVRVQLSVQYRVHSRQMLCIAGNQIPFGWSFLSISKVPMTWNQGDIWTCEVELPAGQRIEYKYVILEEQDWTKLEDEDSEGLVEVTYRSGSDPARPPDVPVIQKQMAIVAWQPGPNRIVQVPTEVELQALEPNGVVERVPARPNQKISYEPELVPRKPDPFEGTWEVLTVSEKEQPFLDRHDVWGWRETSTRPPDLRGFRFDR